MKKENSSGNSNRKEYRKDEEKTERFILPFSEMTIYTADECKDNLLKELHGVKNVEIDLSSLTKIDTAGLQLLILLKREALNHDIKLHFVGHSDEVIEALDLCNLTRYFGDPIIVPNLSTRRS